MAACYGCGELAAVIPQQTVNDIGPTIMASAGPSERTRHPFQSVHVVTAENRMADAYPVTSRNRLRRRYERGHYDRETVHAILDAAMVCHIAYVIDGQPFCTPTSFWREGDRLYWHGSSASRMVRAQAKGLPVCLTVTHLDAVVLARSGFHHSVNYRCVMAYGRARAVTDPAGQASSDGRIHRSLLPRSRGRSAATHSAGDQGHHHPGDGDRGCDGKDPGHRRRDEEEDYASSLVRGVAPADGIWASRRNARANCPASRRTRVECWAIRQGVGSTR